MRDRRGRRGRHHNQAAVRLSREGIDRTNDIKGVDKGILLAFTANKRTVLSIEGARGSIELIWELQMMATLSTPGTTCLLNSSHLLTRSSSRPDRRIGTRK
jgi:hypothetical protein